MPKPRQISKRRVKPVLTKQRFISAKRKCNQCLEDFYTFYDLYEREQNGENRAHILEIITAQMIKQAYNYAIGNKLLSFFPLPVMGHSGIKQERDAFIEESLQNMVMVTNILIDIPGALESPDEMKQWVDDYLDHEASDKP